MIRRGFGTISSRTEQRRLDRQALRNQTNAVPQLIQDIRAGAPLSGSSVVVIGAGMAGLCAAVELEGLGATVTVLEADKNHIGGRVRTHRKNGLSAELGAMRIPEDHDLTRFYATENGVQLRRFVQSNDQAWLSVRGNRVRMKDSQQVLSSFQLTDAERTKGDLELWQSTVSEALEDLSDTRIQELYEETFQSDLVKNLDRSSLYQLWSRRGLSPAAIQLFASTWSLESSLHVSLVEHLREEHEGTWVESFDEVVGGTDLLASSTAARLNSGPRLGCRVFRIEQDTSGANVHYEDASDSKTYSLRADYVVCTVPLGVMHRISFSPELSPAKRDAIRRISYDSSTKVIYRAKRRFWETDDGIYGGGSVSDGVLGTTWYPADNAVEQDTGISGSPALFLASYTWGQSARRMSLRAAKQSVPKELAQLHDSVRTDPSLVDFEIRWSWDEHPHSGGAYAFFAPGDHSDLFSVLCQREGRLWLAGEHASTTHSWIQGAIASGLRVCRAIQEDANGGSQ